MAAKIHLNDIGTKFNFNIVDESGAVIDLSVATFKELRFSKPNGSVVTKTPTFLTNGTDGKIYYVTVLNDLDQVGEWKVQFKTDLPSWQGYSDIGKFKVYENI
jgi:hypothetical protein